MLSLPNGFISFGFRFLSKNSVNTSMHLFSAGTLTCDLFLNYCLINYGIRHSSSPYLSHTPSQATKSNSSSGLLMNYLISGIHVIACLWNGNPGVFLWAKSPIDLVKFKPFTLPWMIWIPAFYILILSTGFSGLWSYDKGSTLDFRHKAALESPAFAQIILSFVIATTIAVHPDCKSCSVMLLTLVTCFLYSINYFTAGFIFIINSTWMKVSLRAYPTFPSFKVGLLTKHYKKWLATYLALYAPPWPSKTPKSARS